MAVGLALLGLLVAVAIPVLRSPAQVESCVERSPSIPVRRAASIDQRPGFEILDPVGGGVWMTRDWTVDAFEAFSFPWTWPFWFKNDPRRGVSDGVAFLRSPGCPSDGQFTYMTAFGREFVQVVELEDLTGSVGNGAIREVELEKYHVLAFDAGSQVQILQGPDASHYLLVAETFARSEEPELPDGWAITARVLEEPVVVELTGTVEVLRLTNEDSYQGPLSADTLGRLMGVQP